MARISNKKGKLTKRYRDPSVYHAPSRRGQQPTLRSLSKSSRRKSKKYYSYNKAQNQNNIIATNKKEAPSTKGCFSAMLVLLIIIVVVVILLSSGSNNTSENSLSTTDASLETSSVVEVSEVDLSAYQDDPNILGNIYIQKEYDNWVLEITGECTNNSSKPIQEITFYLVCCNDDDKPIDSWKYVKKHTIKGLRSGETRDIDWTSGTTTYGKKEFVLYVGYILYEDGSEWGTKEMNHSAVVSRNITLPLEYQEVEKASWKK